MVQVHARVHVIPTQAFDIHEISSQQRLVTTRDLYVFATNVIELRVKDTNTYTYTHKLTHATYEDDYARDRMEIWRGWKDRGSRCNLLTHVHSLKLLHAPVLGCPDQVNFALSGGCCTLCFDR